MNHHYQPVSSKPNFDQIEKEVLEFWKEQEIFKQSMNKNSQQEEFVFFEGPPTANGKPGIHHVLARTFKDLYCRYQSMKGKKVTRQAGWDEHGLPVEIEVQKEHNLQSKADIEALGLEKFNSLCAQSIQKYTHEWEKLTERMAYWVEMEDSYRTSSAKYIEKVWSILKQIYRNNLLYQGQKIVPWAADSGTTLSQAEVSLGYREVEDESLYVKFRLTDSSANDLKRDLSLAIDQKPIYIIAWTTTPWTLPSNMALAVGHNIKYSIYTDDKEEEYLILSSKRQEAVLAEGWQEVSSLEAKSLLHKRYIELFGEQELEVIPGENMAGECFVLDNENIGTGIVHLAAAFGEDDYAACQRYRSQNKNFVETRQFVDPRGVFTEKAPDFLQGESIFNQSKKSSSLEFNRINRIISKYLQDKNLLLKTEKYLHSYPHNWRTDNPLIYYLRPSWYIATQSLKEQMIKANESVEWHPEHIKAGRFGRWLENNIDWSISRERYWGTPLPIWIGEQTGKVQMIGSLQELKQKSGQSIKDPHKPYIDQVTWEENGEIYRRVPEVLDCWFDSGAMPVAALPVQKTKVADYICEAVDQTRGWFYSLLAVSAAMQGKSTQMIPPYKKVLCLGHILDKDGQKMSKSKGNTIDPWELFEGFGADAVRWYMISSYSAGNPIRFSQDGVQEVVKRFMLQLWNTYAFFVLYANLEKINPDELGQFGFHRRLTSLDKWMLTRLEQIIFEFSQECERMEFGKATQLLEKFVDDLSNVWVRANRDRFWNTKGDHAQQKTIDKAAYYVLNECLLGLCRLLAPMLPMFSEHIYQNLRLQHLPESVHLLEWLEAEDISYGERKLLQDMDLALDVINKVHSLRQELKIKTRQPLQAAYLPVNYEPAIEKFADFIKSEINVKELSLKSSITEISLDTEITKELLAEGIARDFIRVVQRLRKEQGFAVSDRISLSIGFSSAEQTELINTQQSQIMKEVLALDWRQLEYEPQQKSYKLQGKEISLILEKAS